MDLAAEGDALSQLITTIMNAMRAAGNDNDERQLAQMSEACKQLAASLDSVGDKNIDPAVQKGRKQWTGDAATHYQEMVDTYFDPAERKALVKSLGHVSEVLLMAKEATHETKRAFRELLKSILQALAISVALSMFTGVMGRYAAWVARAKIAAQGAGLAATILARLIWFLKKVAVPLRKLAELMKRSKALRRGLTVFKSQNWVLNGTQGMSFGKTALTSFKSYAKMFGLQLGAGQFMFVGLGRELKGQSFFAPFGLQYAQMVNSAAISSAFPWGRVGWDKAKKAYGAKALFAAGAMTGTGYTIINDRLEGKTLGQMVKDIGKVAVLNGGWGALNGAALKKIGITGDFQVQLFNSTGAIIPGTALRNLPPPIGVPFKQTEPPAHIDHKKYPEPDTPPLMDYRPQDPTTTAPQASSHQVGGEETLAGIAKRVYGSERYWPQLYEANRDVIGPDPGVLKPGTPLKLPKLK
ncbi:hypothetical protein [Nonomuraea sp. NPDC049129]|uniref:LysM peptidoglycan-binding domain-containing protein n=1 Tax=unclassified Nonomuraea TaxID=2593643 RepID=UPI0033F573F0